MNTFLISGDLKQSARCLDHVRLTRQISECVHVAKLCRTYNALENPTKIWGLMWHPVYKLWLVNDRCSLGHLYHYTSILHQEYVERTSKTHESYTSTNWKKFTDDCPMANKELTWPSSVHESHRSKLLGKDSNHYFTQFTREGLSIPGEMEYEWLSPNEKD